MFVQCIDKYFTMKTLLSTLQTVIVSFLLLKMLERGFVSNIFKLATTFMKIIS